jgi:hypothetical protein
MQGEGEADEGGLRSHLDARSGGRNAEGKVHV